jgi:PAS domain S-box-containing protein
MKPAEEVEYSRLFPKSMLLVEDSPGDASLIMSALKGNVDLFEVKCVASLQAAVTELSKVRYGCVIFDLGLPDGDGLDVVDCIRDAASDSALVVLTGRDDEELGVLAIQHGADDYFVKSELSARGLQRSINYAIERARSKVQARRFSAIVESSYDAIISKDLNLVITSWNAGAERLYGYTASEAVGQSITILMPYDHVDEGLDILTSVSVREVVDDFETIRMRKDGTLVEVSLRVSPLLGTAREVVGASIIGRDISDRRKAEQLKDKLLETAQELSAIVESSADGIVTMDIEGTILTWNRGAQHLYGYSAEEAIGQNMSFLDIDAAFETRLSAMTSFGGSKTIRDLELVRRRRDGTFVDVSLSGSPIYSDDGSVIGIASIGRDISDRRKAEQLKDEFLALVSHELRTPLSSIVAHAELLLDDGPMEETRRRGFLEVIDRNSVRLERLVGDLLFVAQLESDHLSLSMIDVDMVGVVKEAIETMSLRARQSDIKITLFSEQPSLRLKGDPGRLGQAIDNLISNAIKYSPAGKDIAVRILAVNDSCVVEIEDHGIGIATEELGLVFDRFFRGSTATSLHIQGVGLGLLIVKRIIEEHGGDVTVVSEPGVGTTFSVVLPVVQPDLPLPSFSLPSSQGRL